ncbi:MAG: hypothetical protein QHJ82_05600 [Verrucomicrobiota bacterium]|nr:hypothetical protein [Verrucomicrobiota bacterium]
MKTGCKIGPRVDAAGDGRAPGAANPSNAPFVYSACFVVELTTLNPQR